ncbi:hypothetical protein AA0119_g11571 [Alternaria tenuissima]|uniref:Peptidase C14 caspase domain-containing protein n=1 Tax=Alternaria tenuissima TaxID=119927 RepID=A0AB37VY35_9PLEO|nr:hypothetical protein B0T12DRAFT_477712 [Alternaria alternata]RYN16259.1 hypothetical protein AA0115_g12455 [Alternaria tenuissima]RYN89219.1 hypothetical protein AA0119_g11571 [Alternaria tenuissima]RYO05779.1 hypothetical protein AA0121_g12377 [Alternaria tenuissima]
MAPLSRCNVRNPLSPRSSVNDTSSLPSPLSLNPGEIRYPQDDQHEAKLQQCWDKSIAKHLDLPDGYRNVHVLVVKWQDAIDQLDVRQEVDDLTNVFKKVFNYDVTELQLEEKNPQVQLEAEIYRWVYEHDDPNNLLVVYYAGHGVYDKALKVLEFSPTDDVDNDLRAIWNEAERTLIEKVKANVLTIMDCCYASDLLRNVPEHGRTFEMIAASDIGAPTPEPGENSFTRCLIKHLKELAVESSGNYGSYFDTHDLVERMAKERFDSPPRLWRRIPGSSRHIELRKLKPKNERPVQKSSISSHARFLHLGFALKNDTIDEMQIQSLTKELPALFSSKGLPLVNIKWLGCRKEGKPTLKDIAHFVSKNRRELSAITPPSSENKRSADEADLTESTSDRRWCKKPMLNTYASLGE